ncbi:MAG: hypothetical protein LBR89_04345 [Holosporales bacterium]|nr:hypothetical protein [Holosporales bacterium]
MGRYIWESGVVELFGILQKAITQCVRNTVDAEKFLIDQATMLLYK